MRVRNREAVVAALASMEPGELAAVVAEALERQGGDVRVTASLDWVGIADPHPKGLRHG